MLFIEANGELYPLKNFSRFYLKKNGDDPDREDLIGVMNGSSLVLTSSSSLLGATPEYEDLKEWISDPKSNVFSFDIPKDDNLTLGAILAGICLERAGREDISIHEVVGLVKRSMPRFIECAGERADGADDDTDGNFLEELENIIQEEVEDLITLPFC